MPEGPGPTGTDEANLASGCLAMAATGALAPEHPAMSIGTQSMDMDSEIRVLREYMSFPLADEHVPPIVGHRTQTP